MGANEQIFSLVAGTPAVRAHITEQEKQLWAPPSASCLLLLWLAVSAAAVIIIVICDDLPPPPSKMLFLPHPFPLRLIRAKKTALTLYVFPQPTAKS